MRILIVSHQPPLPPFNGFQLALASLLPHLQHKHEVRVVALDAPHDTPDPPWLRVSPPPKGPWVEVTNWGRFALRRRPLRADTLARALMPAVRDELASFDPDLVHVFSARAAAVSSSVVDRPVLLSALDASDRNLEARAALRRGPARLALRLQGRRIRAFIAEEYPRYGAVVTVTPEDAAAIAGLTEGVDVRWIPNGVDPDRFPAGASPRVAHQITFHGVMGYAPNVDAAVWATREILPRIRAVQPAARLVLAGRGPSPEVQHLASTPGVTVTGEVPDVAPWLRETAVYLCPMRRGTGIKNKLLEAMAAGAPCVVTPLSLQGIPAVDGRDLLVGEDADELAGHVLTLLADPRHAARLGEAGRALVLRHHSWAAAADAYARLYTELVATANT